MEFKKCSIGGRIYDGKNQNVRSSMTIDATSPRSTISRHLEANKSMFSFKVVESVSDLQNVGTTDLKPPFVPKHEKKISIMTTATGSQELDPQSGCFDARLLEYFTDPELKVSQHGITIREFFKLLAICHTVLVDEKQEDDVDTNEKTKSFTYKAQSPDEACLVTIAAKSGFVFKGRVQRPETGQNEIQVDILDQEEGFELLQILEFDSDRKRMSVIVRPVSKDPNVQNDVILFCKGADTVIMALLAPGQEVMKSRTNKHLEMFAEEGNALRPIFYD
jgi:magnesium-transporting ATPase (P-type)